MSEKTECPKCGSGLVVEIANQKHCNACGADFAVDRDPVGRRARGETEKRGYPKRG
jgi:ribosomal protein S27AE